MRQTIHTITMLLAFMSGAFFCSGQAKAPVNGLVRDVVTRKPIEGAAITFTSADETANAVSGSDGRFEAELSPGRYLVKVNILSYEVSVLELLAVAGKTTSLVFDMHERTVQLEEVVVESRAVTSRADASVVLPIEKVLRMPANFFDPVRMLTSYPGVVTANDQANNIIVKGNSPNGLLWKLNGMDILNPNHLANAGTISDRPVATGGGVNILSAQMLDNTSFYSGDIPSRYGNAVSGVLDMTVREGNQRDHEFTAQASLIGLDMAAEGPMGKRSSFLANYRYSTVGLLSKMGLNFGGEEITFQDFSFHLKTAAGDKGSLSFFGFGGLSSNWHPAVPRADWEIAKDKYDIDYKSGTAAAGIRYDVPLGEGYTLSLGSTWSGNTQERYSLAPEMIADAGNAWLLTSSNLLSSMALLRGKLSREVVMEAGATVNHYDLDLEDRGFSAGNWFSQNSTPLHTSNTLLQPHLELTWNHQRLKLQASGHGIYSTLTEQGAVDVRGKIQYRTGQESFLGLSAGEVRQQLQTGVNFINNPGLRFFTKQYVELDYRFSLAQWSFQPAVYYQHYKDVPLGLSGYSSVLNTLGEYNPDELRNGGTGENKGVTLQAERRFTSGFYILTGASFYDSRFSNIGFENMSTRFNGRYNAMITAGREKGRSKGSGRSAFGVHGRFVAMGGLKDMTIDQLNSAISGLTVYGSAYTTDPFSVTMKDYFRFDLRLSWRKDKQGYTRTVGVDIQNLTGMQNEAYYYYDHVARAVKTQYQVGIIPVLVYRVDF